MMLLYAPTGLQLCSALIHYAMLTVGSNMCAWLRHKACSLDPSVGANAQKGMLWLMCTAQARANMDVVSKHLELRAKPRCRSLTLTDAAEGEGGAVPVALGHGRRALHHP